MLTYVPNMNHICPNNHLHHYVQKLIKLRFFKIMNTFLKLGVFDRASFIFKKKKKKKKTTIIIFSKKKKKKKSPRFQKNHAFIFKLGAFGSASFK